MPAAAAAKDLRPALAAWACDELHSFLAVGTRTDRPYPLPCIGRKVERLGRISSRIAMVRERDGPLCMHFCFALRQVTQATGLRIADGGRGHRRRALAMPSPSSPRVATAPRAALLVGGWLRWGRR